MSRQRRLQRQVETVRRLTGQLRFELLLLDRHRSREAEREATNGEVADRSRFHSLAEVHAAALLRRSETI